jgi:hypothetical protein
MIFEIFINLPTDKHTLQLTENYSQTKQMIYYKNIQLLHFYATYFSHYSHHQTKSVLKHTEEDKYCRDFADDSCNG